MISWNAFWGGDPKQGNLSTSKFCSHSADIYNKETFQHENCVNNYRASLLKRSVCESGCHVFQLERPYLSNLHPRMPLMTF